MILIINIFFEFHGLFLTFLGLQAMRVFISKDIYFFLITIVTNRVLKKMEHQEASSAFRTALAKSFIITGFMT